MYCDIKELKTPNGGFSYQRLNIDSYQGAVFHQSNSILILGPNGLLPPLSPHIHVGYLGATGISLIKTYPT